MRKRLAWLIVVAGLACTTAGIALIYVPAALIVTGVGLAAIGLFTIEVGGKK